MLNPAEPLMSSSGILKDIPLAATENMNTGERERMRGNCAVPQFPLLFRKGLAGNGPRGKLFI